MIKYEYVIVSKNRNDGELIIDTIGLAGITLPSPKGKMIHDKWTS